ncbi:unnamed protein product [Prunus armeniaca]
MYLYSILKQQESFGWVQANYRKAKERGYFIGHKPSTQKSWRNMWCLAYGDWECPPGKTVTKHISTLPVYRSLASSIKTDLSKEQEDEVERVRSLLSETERECRNLVTQKNLFKSELLQRMTCVIKGSTKATRKHPRNDNEGWVADVLGKRKALEEAHQSMMGMGPRLPPFDLLAPPKLPFGIKDVFPEGVEKVDFSKLHRQKNEVNLAMHRQEIPLVNVFLEGVNKP